MRLKVLPPAFFDRPTSVVAKELLGKFLVRRIGGPSTSPVRSLRTSNGASSGYKTLRVMITDVEVYDGFHDRASHASRGKTKRNEIMFGPAGYWYVYFTYGMHWMLNIVTREQEYPAAILIRAAFDLENKKLVNGPARLTKFLSIDGTLNNRLARRASDLWIEDEEIRNQKTIIKSGPRIGINYAGKYWTNKKLRFWME
jgi:DNA-3-methyladenine glycosylase